METGGASGVTPSPDARRRKVVVVAGVMIALVGVVLWGVVGLVGAAFLWLLIWLGRDGPSARQGKTATAGAFAVVLISTLLVPLSWGMSLPFAAVGVPLAVLGLWTPGWTRRLAVLALVVNVALLALFAAIWIVPA